MARPIPPDRIAALIRCAAEVFIRQGYRQTQMADIAAALGVGKGTLYGYVQSKDALFDTAVRYADRRGEALPGPDMLPIATPAPGATAEYVRGRIANEASGLVLVSALGTARAFATPAAELHAVLADLYDRLHRNRHVIKLIDRCAVDHPTLADAWFQGGRFAQHEMLVTLIERRRAEGSYSTRGAAPVIARTFLESIAFWAVHRHFDAAPQAVDEHEARTTLLDLLAGSVLKGPR